MRFIANRANNQYLMEFLSKRFLENCVEIKAAVAYAGDDDFFDLAISNNIRLTFYGRLDDTIPVHLPILKKFLDSKNPNFLCKLVPDILHAKVIWFIGVGVYIGSANLTPRSLGKNIEAGVFLDQNDIDNKLKLDLEKFFKFLDTDGNSYPLTSEIYEKLEKYEKLLNDSTKSESEAEEYFKNILPSKKEVIHKIAS